MIWAGLAPIRGGGKEREKNPEGIRERDRKRDREIERELGVK